MSDIAKIGSSGSLALQNIQLQDMKRQLETVGKNASASGVQATSPSKEVKEAAEQFEAMLLKTMFGSMWSSMPKGGLLSGSNEEGLFQEMLQGELANEVSRHQSLGIKDVVLRELSKRG